MNLIRSLFAWPLLARELIERAARRRTYAGRVAYGLVLYALFFLALRRVVESASGDPTGMAVLGVGRGLFEQLVTLQIWGVFLFQPALMAGGITYEKERDSLSLLLLTGMSPGKVLIEKYLAGLLPMATLLLLALPLGAITMGYGGVSPQLLAAGACVVVGAWLMSGAFALLCSAWCRTSIGATLVAYLAGAVLLLAPAVVYSAFGRYILWGADLRNVEIPGWVWACWPREVFTRVVAALDEVTMSAASDAAFRWALMAGHTWEHSWPLLAVASVCLLLARIVIVRRTVVPARRISTVRAQRPPGRVLRWWRRFWPVHDDLPKDDPIEWRESGRSVLGRRGRFHFLTLMLAGLVFATSAVLLGLYPKTAGPERLHHFAVVAGTAAVLILVVRSVGAVLSEHSNQTLDILLTTPLGADEIVKEKARALSRYWMLFALILGIIFAMQGWSEYEHVRANMFWRQLGQYWCVGAIALAVYPPLVIWVSLLFALLLRRRARAIIITLAVFGVWHLAPLFVLDLAMDDWRSNPRGLWISLLSPLGILDANEHDKLAHFATNTLHAGGMITKTGEPWAPVAYNFGFYLLLGRLARGLCLRFADRLMRR